MKYWTEYSGHEIVLMGKRNKYDGTIYTFDIETTSYLTLEGKNIQASNYLSLSKKEQDLAIKKSTMYIWMLGINDTVYYGRTWDELYQFFKRLEENCSKNKYIFVHNLSFEFQYLRNVFHMKSVFARKSRKVIRCIIDDFNFEFRCSYVMSNCSLAKLSDVYMLDVVKKVGALDYSLLRHSKTILSEQELEYCEDDCLVVYKYILRELEQYKTFKALPLTSTGHVRKELKETVEKNYRYLHKVRKSINVNPVVYNLMLDAFAGGYTHANWTKANEIIKNVTSFDFTSSYPYVMVSEKYPMTEFRRITFIDKYEELRPDIFAYLVRINFKDIRCKFLNNFISTSKCKKISKPKFDNGRVIEAKELEIVVTDVDLKIIFETYNFSSYEFLDVYWSKKDYLPKEYIEFILQKYVEKTKYKNVEGKELEYMLSKNLFNSLYGMTVTNNIRENVTFDDTIGWDEKDLTNEEIEEKLQNEKKKDYLSFSWGVWVTAYARYNLLSNLIKNDEYQVYADTDSLKIQEGFDISVIEDYNKKVIEKLNKVSKELEIPFEKFSPKDKDGIPHTLGLFENDGIYEEFITQGAKKYAVTKWIPNKKVKKGKTNVIKTNGDKSLVLEITVSGVPKSGCFCLNNLDEFRDNLIFDFKHTNKNIIMYNDNQEKTMLTDYLGEITEVDDKYGCCLLPTTYELGKSEEYAELLSDESSKRSYYK